MTARGLAMAAGMAMAIMGNSGKAAAEDALNSPTFIGATLYAAPGWSAEATAQEPVTRIRLDEPVEFGADVADSASPWYAARIGAESRPAEVDAINLIKRDGKVGDKSGSFLTYAGVGMGKIKFSLNLQSGGLKLAKEKQYKRTQLFLGTRYKLAPSTSLALEYRLVTGSDPIFESDSGLAAIGSSSEFNNHNVLMNFRYKF